MQLVRTVKVNILYHAANKGHCDSKKINKVYS